VQRQLGFLSLQVHYRYANKQLIQFYFRIFGYLDIFISAYQRLFLSMESIVPRGDEAEFEVNRQL